ncbi:MAG: pyridoxal 5'-phosphate synthase glutaminase subunit PdxT [Spirochaetaceae bacterium]
MIIGVLALQGSVLEHSTVIETQGDIVRLVNDPQDLEGISRLIIPGGESTTLAKILKIKGLDRAIINQYHKGLFIWGTCAGLILLANHLKLIDIKVQRNGYGSHSNSFITDIKFQNKICRVKFIRAPKIKEVDKKVDILSMYDGEVVAAEYNRILVTTFHPELTENIDFYKYFRDKKLKNHIIST